MCKKIGAKDFELEGKGKVVLKHPTNGSITTYEGEWLNDKKHGFGTLLKERISESNKEVLDLIQKTEGEWFEGKMHGFCFIYNQDGSTYEGMFVKGKRNGHGR